MYTSLYCSFFKKPHVLLRLWLFIFLDISCLKIIRIFRHCLIYVCAKLNRNLDAWTWADTTKAARLRGYCNGTTEEQKTHKQEGGYKRQAAIAA